MPFYPKLASIPTSRDVTDTFYGYDARLKIGNGWWNKTKNLTSEFFPMLSPRTKRTCCGTVENAGGIMEKGQLAYVDSGSLYYAFRNVGGNLSSGEKQLVGMGAYICVFPDKKAFNTSTNTWENFDASFSGSNVTYTMCHIDGTPYESVIVSSTEPETTSGIWIQIQASDSSFVAAFSYSANSGGWVELNTVYTKITFRTRGQIPQAFKQYDAVEIAGSRYKDINGSKIIYALGGSATEDDYIVVINPMTSLTESSTETISVERHSPDLDFVCECNNRLWGCRFGLDEKGNPVNEIRCCSLGDFRNWNQFLGLSTDSWVGSCGSDGQWTGAINYIGYPTFFKENVIHTVHISSVGAHSINDTPARGVERGSSKSLRVVNETLYYKSRTDVCSYQGGFPQGISDALGDEIYSEAVAGSFGNRYYISMKGEDGKHHLFVYDIKKNIWMHEDEHDSAPEGFASIGTSLYCITDGKLYDLNGIDEKLPAQSEDKMEWMCESGVLYYAQPDNKYVTRFDFRFKGNKDTVVRCEVEYDSDGIWEDKGVMKLNGLNTAVLPVTPHRCDHMKIRLIGKGEFRLFSIAKVLEVGTDV